MTLPVFAFGEYRMEPARDADLFLARAWNLADPEHAWEAERPLYWITQSPIENSYVLRDRAGTVLFWKAIQTAPREIEINIQFDRSQKEVSEARVVRALQAGFAWLKKALPACGIDSVYFKSKNTRLVQFAERGLGFTKDGDVWRWTVTKEVESDGEADHERTEETPQE
jgi:hypothetical protein